MKRAQSNFKRKNNFIATASHNLRQPLQTISLLVELLQHQIMDIAQRSRLDKIETSSKDLNALLNSILDISKLYADAVVADKSHFSIGDLLKSIQGELETECNNTSLELVIEHVDTFVYTDSLLLLRIIKNLVSKAVKYTDSGSVTVATRVDGDLLVLQVKDTGPGIPKEQYQSIFYEYHRLDESDNDRIANFGMGLGLSIVERLVNLLHLDISLDSTMDEGTCFTLSIPLGDAESHREVSRLPTTSSQHDLANYNVVVVEDNPLVMQSMCDLLRHKHCSVHAASSSSEALHILQSLDRLPDLLLVDYQLEDEMTGDILIRKICTSMSACIPAIIVTGNTNSSVIRQASESDFRVLTKPINPDALLSNIASAIREHAGDSEHVFA